MIVECAWCGSLLGTKDGRGIEGTTSGICNECLAVICADTLLDDSPETAPEQAALSPQG